MLNASQQSVTNLDHLPGTLRCVNIALSVQRNVAESIAVEELDCPIQEANQAAQTAEQDTTDDITVARCVLLRDRAQLAQELDDGNNQATKTNAAETVGDGTLESAAGSSLGLRIGVEVPRTVHAGNRGVDRVLQPLRDPIHGEGHKDEQANDLAAAAVSDSISALSIVLVRRVLHVDGDKGDRVPCAECCGEQTADQGHDVDMAVLLRYINCCLEHDNAEGNARAVCSSVQCWDILSRRYVHPRDERDNVEDTEKQENNASRPVPAVQHVDGCCKAEDDI